MQRRRVGATGPAMHRSRSTDPGVLGIAGRRRTVSHEMLNRGELVIARSGATALFLGLAAAPAHASDQLELTPDLFVTAVLLLAFVALVFPLNALIFRPLLRVMDKREENIAGARRRAEQVQAQGNEALDRYEESIRAAREEMVSHRRQHLEAARAELAQTTRAAKDDAERELERAREELLASIDDARDNLRASAEELARISAERVLGRRLL